MVGGLLTLIHFVSWEAWGPQHFRLCPAVLIVGLLQPTQQLGIHFIARSEAGLELHGLADLRGPQASSGFCPSRRRPRSSNA
jgi:hypothetical protein